MVVAAQRVIVVFPRPFPVAVEIHMGTAVCLQLIHTVSMHSVTLLPVLFVEHLGLSLVEVAHLLVAFLEDTQVEVMLATVVAVIVVAA